MMTFGFSDSTVPSRACTVNFPGTEESMWGVIPGMGPLTLGIG